MAVNKELVKIGVEQTIKKLNLLSNILLRGDVDTQGALKVLDEVKVKLALVESTIRGNLDSFTKIKDKN